MPPLPRQRTWNIACKVIDNFGDIGVSWRLACQLAALGQSVRLWVNDASALAWMAPAGFRGIEVLPFDAAPQEWHVGDVALETFGCDLPDGLLAMLRNASAVAAPTWINLEYLSAEPYVERSHGLPSPVLHGRAQGLTRQFFYPGFGPLTGGLLREPDLAGRQSTLDPKAWLAAHQVAWTGQRLISLFCYEPPALADLLQQLAAGAEPSMLLVTAGRASSAVRQLGLGADMADTAVSGSLQLYFLPLLTQTEFDQLLRCCDLNFVRGEDSLVRAIWAARPWIWQIYPQHDGAHAAKLEALLNRCALPPTWACLQRQWNGLQGGPLETPDLPAWSSAAIQLRDTLWQQSDLVERLLKFVAQIEAKNR